MSRFAKKAASLITICEYDDHEEILKLQETVNENLAVIAEQSLTIQRFQAELTEVRQTSDEINAENDELVNDLQDVIEENSALLLLLNEIFEKKKQLEDQVDSLLHDKDQLKEKLEFEREKILEPNEMAEEMIFIRNHMKRKMKEATEKQLELELHVKNLSSERDDLQQSLENMLLKGEQTKPKPEVVVWTPEEKCKTDESQNEVCDHKTNNKNPKNSPFGGFTRRLGCDKLQLQQRLEKFPMQESQKEICDDEANNKSLSSPAFGGFLAELEDCGDRKGDGGSVITCSDDTICTSDESSIALKAYESCTPVSSSLQTKYKPISHILRGINANFLVKTMSGNNLSSF
mmetsp:Transcript_54385/g.80690  ORF Transcript_54385/g.80690 Transcript_54385/m.80690 type:complete len:347 (-) Transcript_54385:71-1111(-)|eukprot:CAMPEP_0195517194 /NCGR_PEP_ID=MMETSP0794_2-20130614/10233_1 /TAXON_ID=515487 /ORGANISM="Stephanopyxis turris, Strain CCMP 815" /LENGTH=346 /DNA_ID=CAMNT_0040645963 /DNA_START=53 /DNA_END=1093 /DNA_ORIENTATION=+